MNPSSAGANEDSEQQEEEEQLQESPDTLVDNSDSPPAALEAAAEAGGGEEAGEAEGMEDPMEEDAANPATVFCIRLMQPRSNLMHKMSVPELCRTFR